MLEHLYKRPLLSLRLSPPILPPTLSYLWHRLTRIFMVFLNFSSFANFGLIHVNPITVDWTANITNMNRSWHETSCTSRYPCRRRGPWCSLRWAGTWPRNYSTSPSWDCSFSYNEDQRFKLWREHYLQHINRVFFTIVLGYCLPA